MKISRRRLFGWLAGLPLVPLALSLKPAEGIAGLGHLEFDSGGEPMLIAGQSAADPPLLVESATDRAFIRGYEAKVHEIFQQRGQKLPTPTTVYRVRHGRTERWLRYDFDD